MAFAVKWPKIIANLSGTPEFHLATPHPAPASITGRSDCDNVAIDTRIDSDTRTCPRLSTRLTGAEERVQRTLSCAIRRFKPLKVHQNSENKSVEARESPEEKQFESSPGRAKVTTVD